MKREIRVLGVDDGFFRKGQAAPVLVVGAVMRGTDELDGVLSCFVAPDGTDATEKIARMVNESKYKQELRAIMLNGTVVAGFNVVDIRELSEKTRLPVIAVLRKEPNNSKVMNALENLEDGPAKLRLLEKAGEFFAFRKIRFQLAGATPDQAFKMIDAVLKKSNVPEPVRVAHLIASGVSAGQSTKRV